MGDVIESANYFDSSARLSHAHLAILLKATKGDKALRV